MSCNCWGFQFTIVFDAQKKAVIQNLGGGGGATKNLFFMKSTMYYCNIFRFLTLTLECEL